MKKSIVLFFILVFTISFGQSLNDYKYALVPSKFSFLKEPNQYRLNNLSKLYMEKYGFEIYLDTDTQPSEFENQNCNKVFVDVIDNSGMFATKVSVVLKDCKGKILYTSKEGSSRDKEYAIAYNIALRQAFESMGSIHHNYVAVSVPAVTEDFSTKIPIGYNDFTYAVKTIPDGFLITDKANPKFFLKLLRTSNSQIFIGQSNEENGLVTVKKDDIIFEYYKNNLLISQMLMVKL
jgi:hypothetical protein